MTGYESKKAMAQDKLEQWDTPSEAFNEWWNGEYDDSTNPFTKHSLAYWAFAGWQAALAQPAQEPVTLLPKVDVCMRAEAHGIDPNTNGLYGFYVDCVSSSPLQRPWVGLTESEWFEWWRVSQVAHETEAEIDFADFLIIAQAVTAKLKDKNGA